MADRSEGTENSGGFHSGSSSFSPHSSRTINLSSSSSTTESSGSKSSLPLRKRKINFFENNQQEESKPEASSLQIKPKSKAAKRRKLSASKRNFKVNKPSTKKKSPAKKSSDVNLIDSIETQEDLEKPSTSKVRRRSSRGSYHVGFYAELEQQNFAAFRSHTSELKSQGEDPELIIPSREFPEPSTSRKRESEISKFKRREPETSKFRRKESEETVAKNKLQSSAPKRKHHLDDRNNKKENKNPKTSAKFPVKSKTSNLSNTPKEKKNPEKKSQSNSTRLHSTVSSRTLKGSQAALNKAEKGLKSKGTQSYSKGTQSNKGQKNSTSKRPQPNLYNSGKGSKAHQSNLINSEKGSKGAKKFSKESKKTMTERKPSWQTIEHKLDQEQNLSTSKGQKATRRHTLPSRSDSDIMGVNLSKCVSAKSSSDESTNSTDFGLFSEPEPSTSGVSNGADEPQSNSGVLNQIMRRLPRKKKSNSDQDISEIHIPNPYVSAEIKNDEPFLLGSRRQDVKRRINNEHYQKKESKNFKDLAVFDVKAELDSSIERPIQKSYPLRNRIKLISDGTASSYLNNTAPEAATASPVPETAAGALSQSLPSSPSSPGGVLLDTFRRFRVGKLSNDHSSNSKKNQSKDTKSSSGVLKRASGSRKSPLLSKRSGRKPSLSAIPTTTVATSRTSNLPPLSQGLFHLGFGESSPLTVPPPDLSNVLGVGATSLFPSSTLSSLGSLGTASVPVINATSASSASGLSLSGALGGLMSTAGDNADVDESEMGRLQALLASRGLPPSLFGALGPRVHDILHRSVASSMSECFTNY